MYSVMSDFEFEKLKSIVCLLPRLIREGHKVLFVCAFTFFIVLLCALQLVFAYYPAVSHACEGHVNTCKHPQRYVFPCHFVNGRPHGIYLDKTLYSVCGRYYPSYPFPEIRYRRLRPRYARYEKYRHRCEHEHQHRRFASFHHR